MASQKVRNEKTSISTKNKKTIHTVKKEQRVKNKHYKEHLKFKKYLFYMNYNTKVLLSLLILLGLLIAFIYFMSMTFSITKGETIKYHDKSTIDYKVYLKDNDFYENEYLDKNMAYVASLIDKININYNYTFEANENSNINYKYKIIATLYIASMNNDKVFYKNDYELKSETSGEIVNKKNYNIDEEISIDYSEYNTLANKFKSKYAVNTNSYLEVCLQVNEISKPNNSYGVNNTKVSSLKIPLSQQEINIGLDEKTINEEKQFMSDYQIQIVNKDYIYLDIILLILIVLFLIKLIKKIAIMNKKVSKYDRYINRILRGYDRLIVNVKTQPKLEDYNVIKVESFEELIDVRDNTKEPIKYYVITEHLKSEFFITNNNDLYLYVVKEADLNKD